MTDLMTPFISISGDSRDTLVNDRAAVLPALREAMKLMGETNPNGRNYIGQNEAYERDRAIYAERFSALDTLYNTLLDEALAIDWGGER